MAQTLIIGLINLYQHTLSPDHGWLRVFFPRGVCRFHPTCSEYTKDAIRRYGPGHGLWLGLQRVSRCHPLHPGGVDPVPDSLSLKSTND